MKIVKLVNLGAGLLLGCGGPANVESGPREVASSATQISIPSVTFDLQTLPGGDWPKSTAVGHIDADPHLDVVLGSRDSADVHVYFGDGRGGFEARDARPPLAVEGFPFYLALADMNADGAQDLVVADETAKALKIYVNDGGSFHDRWDAEVPVDKKGAATNRGAEEPIALAIADFNDDGWADVVAFQRDDDAAFVFQNDKQAGAPGLTLKQTIDLPSKATPWAAMAVDVDGRAGLDVAFTQVKDGRGKVPGAVGFLFNTSSATDVSFSLASPAQEVPVGPWPYDIDAGDFDRDGRPDLAVANANDGAVGLSVLTRKAEEIGAAPPYAVTTLPAGTNPKDAQVADFDGDGDDDVVVANHLSSSFSFYFNCGGGAFAPETLSKLPDLMRPIGVKKARQRGDGRWGLVFGSAGTDKLFSLTNVASTPKACE